MRRSMAGVLVAAGVLLMSAAPAHAVRVASYYGYWTGYVFIDAEPGETNTVEVTGLPARESTQADPLNGQVVPAVVTIRDTSAPITTYGGDDFVPCEIVDPHTARCQGYAQRFGSDDPTPVKSTITHIRAQMGDLSDRIRVPTHSLALHLNVNGGTGDDTLANYTSDGLTASGGDGNDRIVNRGSGGDRVDPVIQGGAGDDAIDVVNLAGDWVTCGAGNDILYADPEDFFYEEVRECETEIKHPVDTHYLNCPLCYVPVEEWLPPIPPVPARR